MRKTGSDVIKAREGRDIAYQNCLCSIFHGTISAGTLMSGDLTTELVLLVQSSIGSQGTVATPETTLQTA